MPKRNVIKLYGADQYYHIYNRGSNKMEIFREPDDYFYFLGLFKRHLSDGEMSDKNGRLFVKYIEEVELVAFCLMPNHFHLLCYLKDPEGIVHLMRSVMTAYTMFFNKKYKHTGQLCEGTFLASRIDNEIYLWQVSRYIHLNPTDITGDYVNYDYSSMSYYKGIKRAEWLHPERLVETKKEISEYAEFVEDQSGMKKDLEFLVNILAAE